MPIDIGTSLQQLVHVAQRLRLDGPTDDISVLGQGQLTIALSVDGYVVRFPRSDFAREELRREISVIDGIRPRVSVALPEVVAVELDREIGEAFVAHRLLPGVPLTRTIIASFSPDTKTRVAEAVATFLRELHAVPPEGVPAAPVRSVRGLAASLRAEAAELLWSRLSLQGRERVERELGAMADAGGELSVPCASDVGGNIIYDALSGSVAFIDFGDTMVSDPVLDVASLCALDEGLAAACADLYSVLGERLEGSRAVSATFALQDVLYGARQGDWEYVDVSLHEYDPGAE